MSAAAAIAAAALYGLADASSHIHRYTYVFYCLPTYVSYCLPTYVSCIRHMTGMDFFDFDAIPNAVLSPNHAHVPPFNAHVPPFHVGTVSNHDSTGSVDELDTSCASARLCVPFCDEQLDFFDMDLASTELAMEVPIGGNHVASIENKDVQIHDRGGSVETEAPTRTDNKSEDQSPLHDETVPLYVAYGIQLRSRAAPTTRRYEHSVCWQTVVQTQILSAVGLGQQNVR